MVRKIISCLFLLFSGFILFSNEKNISVAMFDGSAPILFKDDNGEVTGFFPSLLNSLLPEYEIEYITDITFQEAKEKVISGDIDIIPAFIKTPGRESKFYFNKEVPMVSWGELFVQ